MKREELIAYDRWLTENKWGSSEIVTPEQAADLYLAEHPLPPAEGAEEFLKLPQNHGKLKYCPAHFLPILIRLIEGFATLHAQRIADKMVSERLREELIKYDQYYWGQRGNSESEVDAYLKTRESNEGTCSL